jgi:MlrC C-terminus
VSTIWGQILGTGKRPALTLKRSLRIRTCSTASASSSSAPGRTRGRRRQRGGGLAGRWNRAAARAPRSGSNRAVVTIADAEAAREAAATGAGTELEILVGGKIDDRHGAPVPIRGRVVRVTDGRYRARGTWLTGREFELGTTAVVDAAGVTLVLTEHAVPPPIVSSSRRSESSRATRRSTSSRGQSPGELRTERSPERSSRLTPRESVRSTPPRSSARRPR